MRKYITLTLLLLAGVLTANAASRQEMEQARALVAKWGVRSQNPGSGYLDGTNPKNIDQLKAVVKSHETDNNNLSKISLTMPPEGDYQSWDNAKMTEYWVSQYNKSVPAGGDKDFCRSKLKGQLASISTTVVVKEPSDSKKENVTEDISVAETETVDENDGQNEDNGPEDNQSEENGIAADLVNAAEADPEVEPLDLPGTGGEREAAEGSKMLSESSSNVWIIVMLVILVLVVLALVGYASNLMARNKENQGNPRRPHGENGNHEEAEAADEIPVDINPRPTAEPTYSDPDAQQPKAAVADSASPAAAAMTSPAAATRRPAPRITKPRIIFLSNANAEGVFLRAEAQYNMGNSIFKLITSDGYTGTFSVIDDPTVHEMALRMPVDFLANACSGRNLQLSEGFRAIVTDSTGTAVFEDGRWRVARKAQIHYTL